MDRPAPGPTRIPARDAPPVTTPSEAPATPDPSASREQLLADWVQALGTAGVIDAIARDMLPVDLGYSATSGSAGSRAALIGELLRDLVIQCPLPEVWAAVLGHVAWPHCLRALPATAPWPDWMVGVRTHLTTALRTAQPAIVRVWDPLGYLAERRPAFLLEDPALQSALRSHLEDQTEARDDADRLGALTRGHGTSAVAPLPAPPPASTPPTGSKSSPSSGSATGPAAAVAAAAAARQPRAGVFTGVLRPPMLLSKAGGRALQVLARLGVLTPEEGDHLLERPADVSLIVADLVALPWMTPTHWAALLAYLPSATADDLQIRSRALLAIDTQIPAGAPLPPPLLVRDWAFGCWDLLPTMEWIQATPEARRRLVDRLRNADLEWLLYQMAHHPEHLQHGGLLMGQYTTRTRPLYEVAAQRGILRAQDLAYALQSDNAELRASTICLLETLPPTPGFAYQRSSLPGTPPRRPG